MASNKLDVELGHVAVRESAVSGSSSGVQTATQYPNIYTGGATPLSVYQTLIGITTDVQLGGRSAAQRPRLIISHIFFPPKSVGGRNMGLYQQAINQEWKNRIACFIATYMINTIYILQILLAATFTALSAYQDRSSIPLTTLGAINTVVAGILAWLKGQGIPYRFRRARDQFANLVKDIEMTERLFAEYNHISINPGIGEDVPDPRKEVDRLLQKFDLARLDQQNNYPEVYVTAQLPGDNKTQTDNLMKSMNTVTNDMQTAFAKREQDLIERIQLLEVALKPSSTVGGGVAPSTTA